METGNYKTIDEYLAAQPKHVRDLLQQLRVTIHKAAPEAQEVISYRMPAFKQKRVLVYFAGYATHIGFYPTASGIAAFKKEFGKYKWSKGAVQFPLDQPLPLRLVERIVRFKVREEGSR